MKIGIKVAVLVVLALLAFGTGRASVRPHLDNNFFEFCRQSAYCDTLQDVPNDDPRGLYECSCEWPKAETITDDFSNSKQFSRQAR